MAIESSPSGASRLEIAAVEIYPFDVRMREPFRIASMVSTVSANVLVRIVTREGIDGWGEASSLHAIAGEIQGTNIAAARDLRPLLLGRNPLEIGPLVAEMARFLPHNTTIRGVLACENVAFLDLDSSWEHAEDPILGGLRYENGTIEVPEEPGIGARPDPARLAGIEEV